MKLPHLRHKWKLGGTAGELPRLQCSVCGKSKDAGVPADPHAVAGAIGAHAQTHLSAD